MARRFILRCKDAEPDVFAWAFVGVSCAAPVVEGGRLPLDRGDLWLVATDDEVDFGRHRAIERPVSDKDVMHRIARLAMADKARSAVVAHHDGSEQDEEDARPHPAQIDGDVAGEDELARTIGSLRQVEGRNRQ